MLGHSWTPVKGVFCGCCGGSWFHFPWLVNIDGVCFFSVVRHFEDHLHVVGRTEATNSFVNILAVRSWDEVNILSRLEFKSSRDWTERSECNCKELEALRLITNCHNFGFGVGNPAGIKFLFRYTVDHMFLLRVEWTDDVDLIVFPRKISLVDIHDMVGVVNSKHGVGCVPEN